MKQAFWRWTFYRLCAIRNALNTAISYSRIQAGYKAGGRSVRPEPTGAA